MQHVRIALRTGVLAMQQIRSGTEALVDWDDHLLIGRCKTTLSPTRRARATDSRRHDKTVKLAVSKLMRKSDSDRDKCNTTCV